MRRITNAGLGMIKHHEGLRLRVYKDVAGKETIGYGHLLLPGESFPFGITEEEAEAILLRDLEKAERSVLRLITVPLTDPQFDALVSFTFNLGGGALQRSTLRRKVNRGDYAAAAREFGKWIWAGGKKWPGLIRRRADEALRFMEDPAPKPAPVQRVVTDRKARLPWLRSHSPVSFHPIG